MLKAAIIYLQGSGGNLLARTLSLSEQTVAYLPSYLASQQPTMEVSVAERLNFYNNWNSSDWITTENDLRIWYHAGLQDFVNYEVSKKWLIDSFHPAMFLYEIKKKVLFENEKSWENLIFIKFEPEELDTIKKLAVLKRQDLGHLDQIQLIELPCWTKLIEKYSSALSINWKDMLESSSYISSIKKLAKAMNLNLDYCAIEKLWTSWHTETMKVLHE